MHKDCLGCDSGLQEPWVVRLWSGRAVCVGGQAPADAVGHVAGRKTAPKGVHVPIPRICDCVKCHGTGN